MNIYGAPTHEHRPVEVNGNMKACADCGLIIFEKPEVQIADVIKLTPYESTWEYIEKENSNP